jgi:cytosine deaminase
MGLCSSVIFASVHSLLAADAETPTRGPVVMNADMGVRGLRGVAVPVDLLSDAAAFGGTALGDLRCGTLVIRNGRGRGWRSNPIDRPTRIVLPGLVEAHVHLDKCHSIDRCTDVGGDLMTAAIAAAAGTRHSGRETTCGQPGRARVMAELIAAGCHVGAHPRGLGHATESRTAPWPGTCWGPGEEARAQGVILQRMRRSPPSTR